MPMNSLLYPPRLGVGFTGVLGFFFFFWMDAEMLRKNDVRRQKRLICDVSRVNWENQPWDGSSERYIFVFVRCDFREIV